MKVHQLLPNLYVSAWPDRKTLIEEDFDVIVTCCWKELPDGLKELCTKHYHFGMSDSTQIPGKIPPEVPDAVKVVVDAIERNQRVLVHCYAGHNRSWLTATLAYVVLTGQTKRQAYGKAVAIYNGAFLNPAFEEYMNA